MCGICGLIRFDNKPVQEASIREMMHIMKHRGPDDEGIFLEGNMGFGFVRLSIIDLSQAGHQPMLSRDGRYVMVFNGEIFNYIELREELQKKGVIFYTQTDSEVLLNSYIFWGEACLDHFNGMWAFVIYDRLEKKIFGSRDRHGIKPFYYLQTTDFLAFASEIPPLLSLLNHKPVPDYQSIFDYLAFNRTDQTERTFFEEIKKLQHGHCISFNQLSSIINHQSSIKKWYNLREHVASTVGFSGPQEYRELFSSAVNLRLRSDVPLGVCFSGGLDSSSIVSILLKEYNKTDLNTFSAVYGKGQTGDETEFINEYKSQLKNMYFITPSAETLQSDLTCFIRAHAEPMPSTSPYAQFKVMELAKGNVVVTLDGQGADEELAGYHYFFGFFFKELLKQWRLGKLSTEMFHYMHNHHSLYGLKTFLYFLLPDNFKTELRVEEKGYINKEFADNYKQGNSIAGSLYDSENLKDALIDHFEYKLEHLLKWEDRNSMWFSLEARVPYLDYRLVEKTLATTSDLIISKGITKHILRASMEGILPEKIRNRKDKIGFETPQKEWFRETQWKTYILNILNSKSFAERSIINQGKAIKILDSHFSGKVDASNEIWKWMHLEMWFKAFID
jgi:asparagine synthase (glutamine-hydrolysing)